MSRYIIEIDESENGLIYDENHNLVFPDILRTIHAALDRGKYKQRTLTANTQLQAYVRAFDWCFPQKRSDIFSSGKCVYFILSSGDPDVIKIGYTDSLSSRTKALEREIGYAITVTAFIRTNTHRDIEMLLHAKFSEYRVSGEWFLKEPVMAWIKETLTS